MELTSSDSEGRSAAGEVPVQLAKAGPRYNARGAILSSGYLTHPTIAEVQVGASPKPIFVLNLNHVLHSNRLSHRHHTPLLPADDDPHGVLTTSSLGRGIEKEKQN